MSPRWPKTLLLALLAFVLAAFVAAPARAGDPDLVDLALVWARGDYRAPLICDFDGRPRRGLRRVLIAPGSRRALRRSDRLIFYDLEAEDASRCFSELGSEEPNVIGTLEITLEAPSRPDIARYDFESALRRAGGFTFRIERGRLRFLPVSGDAEGAREVDFAGGSARLVRVERGSDLARLLSEIPGRRRLRLVLKAPDGTQAEFALVEVAPR